MHSYPSIFNLGHRGVRDILCGPVVVQEKVDGSQFSFQVQNKRVSHEAGELLGALTSENVLVMKSKGAQVFSDTTDKLFKPAVETVLRLFGEGKLVPGWTYRGEVLAKPKHNTLAYDRVPTGNIILFDIDRGEEDYLPYGDPEKFDQVSAVTKEAASLGLECVPTLYEGVVASLEQVHAFLDRVSVLGGAKIEGVVIKAYGTYGLDKKTLMAKYVSEAFKEVHGADWKSRNPGRADILEQIVERYKMPARWQKAVQHLREAGTLQDAVQDIGPLMKEVPVDVEKECKDEIIEALWTHFWPQIKRGITAGLPQWYKDELAKTAFAPATVADLADPRPVETT